MRVRIEPSRLHGVLAAPPSKSFAHRAIICAALADGISNIFNISESEDISATLDCIQALGALTKKIDNSVIISGGNSAKSTVFPCRESGSTLRFLFPISLSLCENVQFTGSERLIKRGIGVYQNIFEKKGVSFSKTATSISASGRLIAGNYEVTGNISSQYITGLLLALPLLDGDSKVTVVPPFESKPYVDITTYVMEKFGVKIQKDGENIYIVKGKQLFFPCSMTVEGDWSNSAVFFALKSLGADITVSGLNENSLQGDRAILDFIKRLDEKTPEIDLSLCPDLAPVLFALAGAKNGAKFTGTRRLKIKESDRTLSMSAELSKFGIKTEISENSVTVYGGKLQAPKTPISSHNDHRVVMATAMLLTLVGGEICGAEAITKSYPDFFESLKSLGVEVYYEN